MIKVRNPENLLNRKQRQAMAGISGFWLIAFWVSGVLTLAAAFYLKHLELIAYRDPAMRFFLAFAGGLTLIFALFFSFASLLERVSLQRSWKVQKYRRYHFVATLFVLLCSWIGLMVGAQQMLKMETRALAEKGELRKVILDRVVYSSGKNAHCKHYFQLDHPGQTTYDLYVQRKANTFQVGDTILLRVLPQNPTVFSVIDTAQK
jgi:hypothetical protein